MTDAQKQLAYFGSALAVGVGGWYGFRLFVRAKTREVLIEEYNFDRVLRNIEAIEDMAGIDLNLPSFDELVVSLVPVWDTVLPDAAFADILDKGRASRYWPEAYKKPVNKKWEKMIFRAMKAAAETPESADAIQMGAAAFVAVLSGD
jgi:hypothetical protein